VAACQCEGGTPIPSPPRCLPGGGFVSPPPPPDPRVLARQRANARYNDLIRKLRDDFSFITEQNAQEWLGMERSSDEAFLKAADALDRSLVDQINWFNEDLDKDRGKVQSVESFPAKAAALRHNIGVVDRDIERYGTPLSDARRELDRLTGAITAFGNIQEKYRLRMARDRWLAAEVWRVYLPRKYVFVDAEKEAKILRNAGIPVEGLCLPFVDASTPELEVIPPWVLHRFDFSYTPAAAAAPAHLSYHRLQGTPEEVMVGLEADERKAHNAFVARNDYDMAHSERFEAEKLDNQLRQLEQQQNEKMQRLQEILKERKTVFPELNAARKNVKSEADRLISRATDSLLWEITKNMAIEKCKRLVGKVYRGKLAALDLTEQEIFDHYQEKHFNIFSLPETAFHVRDVKALQNDILTLLNHDQDYAKTAVRLAAHGDPGEIRDFVDGMFGQLDKEGGKLIDDALSASSSLPEPVRTLVAKYFKVQVHRASEAE
jgi:hypothetical protein